MYNPFGGNKFPYTNFHELNLDWIIEIAKNFLDQYTHIQETIDTGLEDLQELATTLEEQLQAWYDSHSEDIANQLADSLEQLNSWYTTHQGYLDAYLTSSITAFNQAADEKAANTLESIPDDYTTLSDNVGVIGNTLDEVTQRTENLVDILHPNIVHLFPNTSTQKLSENDDVRSIIIPVDSTRGTTLAFYKGVNSRFSVTTLDTETPAEHTQYLANTNFGATATTGTITINSAVKAILVWFWYSDTPTPVEVLDSLTVVYRTSAVSIKSRIPYQDPYANHQILSSSADLNSDDNLQTGSFYLNVNNGTIEHAPLGIQSGAFYVSNVSADGPGRRRCVLQRCYIQSPVYMRSTVWYRFIDTETKQIYQDWNTDKKSWFCANVTIFGDSISAGYPDATNDSYHWWAYLKKYYDFTNYAQSGAGIIYENNNKSGIIFANNFVDNTQNYLIIFMGTNDYGNDMPLGTINDSPGTSTVCAGLKYMIETCMQNNHLLSIIGILPINRSDVGNLASNWAFNTPNSAGYTLNDLCDALKTIYESYGIPVIDNRQSVFQKLNMNILTGDGLHPTLEGYRRLSQHLGGEINRIIAPI